MHIHIQILPQPNKIPDIKAVRYALNLGLVQSRSLVEAAHDVVLTEGQLNALLVELPGRVRVSEPKNANVLEPYDAVDAAAGSRPDDVVLTFDASYHFQEMVALRLAFHLLVRVRFTLEQATVILGQIAVRGRQLPKVAPVLNPKVIVAGPEPKKATATDGAEVRKAA